MSVLVSTVAMSVAMSVSVVFAEESAEKTAMVVEAMEEDAFGSLNFIVRGNYSGRGGADCNNSEKQEEYELHIGSGRFVRAVLIC